MGRSTECDDPPRYDQAVQDRILFEEMAAAARRLVGNPGSRQNPPPIFPKRAR